MIIYATCAQCKRALTKDSGERIIAHEPEYIRITGQLTLGTAVTLDGTWLDVVESDDQGRRVHCLEDGTALGASPPWC